MDATKRAELEPIFASLNPEAAGLMGFPPVGDDGDGDGSDADLAQIIYYGNSTADDLPMLEFAIKLGRALETARIVAWLREQSDKGADLGLASEKGTTRRSAYGGGSLALSRAADEIAKGGHLEGSA